MFYDRVALAYHPGLSEQEFFRRFQLIVMGLVRRGYRYRSGPHIQSPLLAHEREELIAMLREYYRSEQFPYKCLERREWELRTNHDPALARR